MTGRPHYHDVNVKITSMNVIQKDLVNVLANYQRAPGDIVTQALVNILVSILSSVPSEARVPYTEEILEEIYNRVKNSMT